MDDVRTHASALASKLLLRGNTISASAERLSAEYLEDLHNTSNTRVFFFFLLPNLQTASYKGLSSCESLRSTTLNASILREYIFVHIYITKEMQRTWDTKRS